VRRTIRSFAYSRTALLLIALLSAVLLGGVREASCAMHGLGAARSGASAAAHHSTHADPHAAQASSQGGQRSHPDGEPGCDCSCIGDCTMATSPATAPTAVTLRVALVEPAPRLPLDREPAHTPPRQPDRRLPFANGPPASALS
jgi:hypothetical protein